MANLTYDEAVQWMRAQPQYTEVVKDCYLDEDNLTAAQRFAQSEEFAAVRQVLSLDQTTQPCKILDVGCGNGIASYAFASLGHQVTAIDPNPSDDLGLGAVQRLANCVPSGAITTVQTDAETMPFPDGTFDIIYARQALHHFGDLQQGLRECARVLKPGGKFLATREPVVNDDAQLQVFLAEHLLHQLHGGENAHAFKTYLAACQQAGLQPLQSFAHFATVINHYPISNGEIRNWLTQVVTRKVGKPIGTWLATVSWVETLFRDRLSRNAWNTPGRHYTFLCQKLR